MTVLVTGGAGYIGSHMVLALVDAGEEVVVLDNLSSGFWWAVAPQAKLVEGDIDNAEFLARLMADPRLAFEHVDGVLVGAAADALGVGLGVGDDAAALGHGLLGQPAFVDEKRGLLLGTGDDPLRLLLGLLDDPLAFGVDPLRRADLFGDGDSELVDEAERGRLVDDDVVRQRKLLAVRDDRLEALDEEDDVDRRALRGIDRSPAARSGRAAWASAGLSHARTAPEASAG